jgi:hypothetical protein
VLQHLMISGEMPGAGFTRKAMNEVILPLATAPAGITPPDSGTRG